MYKLFLYQSNDQVQPFCRFRSWPSGPTGMKSEGPSGGTAPALATAHNEQMTVTVTARATIRRTQWLSNERWMDAEGDLPYDRNDYRDGTVFVLGAEGRGLRPRVRDSCDAAATIPMRGRVESLNVGTAAAVLLFEAVRQRRGG